MRRMILASASPRRKEIMSQAGFEFEIIPAEGEEHPGERTPSDTVSFLSRQKAREVADRLGDDDAVIIGADTVVSIDGLILGKPKDREDAVKSLKLLSGRTHEVFTGVTVIAGDKELSFVERTEVDFYSLTDAEIYEWVESGAADDKAGSYAIQGAFAVHINRIRGDFYNVMGLPVASLYHLLKENGLL